MRWYRYPEKTEYKLSVVIIFYNMCREAQRTLYSLSNLYQINIKDVAYEVIAIDNGSKEPLDPDSVKGFGSNFQYLYLEAGTPSPCKAINYGVDVAQGDWVTLCIDGARILSPGILHYSILATKIFENPFIYTLGMHIGAKPQNYLVEENYTQKDEDKLLESIDWKQDGYRLFDISSVALSSKSGYLSELTESNCVTLQKRTYKKMGGFDEKFVSPGGGLTNLDFFNRVVEFDGVSPVLLLGEATFHQIHGGTATNVPLKDHPIKKMAQEYNTVRGKPYQPSYIPPILFGRVHSRCRHLFTYTQDD